MFFAASSDVQHVTDVTQRLLDDGILADDERDTLLSAARDSEIGGDRDEIRNFSRKADKIELLLDEHASLVAAVELALREITE